MNQQANFNELCTFGMMFLFACAEEVDEVDEVDPGEPDEEEDD